MKLETIVEAKNLSEQIENYVYLEQHVNNGSPSGFTSVHQVSSAYRPSVRTFEIPMFPIDTNDTTMFESNPSRNIKSIIEETSGKIGFCLHPDVAEYYQCEKPDNKLVVSPTASSRTVLNRTNDMPFFIKLHYHQLIGRVTRHLSPKRLSGANTVTKELRSLSNSRLSDSFAFLPESLNLSTNVFGEQMGVTYRDFEPYPNVSDNRFMIPVFSLFGIDDKAQEDSSLLTQILNTRGKPFEDFISIIELLIEAFRTIIEDGGLWPENHAQNILLEFNSNLDAKRVVHRDLYEFYADIQTREKLGLDNSEFKKTLDIHRDDQLYNQMKSYLFDFKFGEYVLRPLVCDFCRNFPYNEEDLYELIRHIVHMSSSIWRVAFNPYEKYYYFPPIEKTYVNGLPVFSEGDSPTFR